jgi:hypothetical protein
MNTKIEFGTNQSLTSKLKNLLWDAKGYIGQLIESAPMVCLSGSALSENGNPKN